LAWFGNILETSPYEREKPLLMYCIPLLEEREIKVCSLNLCSKAQAANPSLQGEGEQKGCQTTNINRVRLLSFKALLKFVLVKKPHPMKV